MVLSHQIFKIKRFIYFFFLKKIRNSDDKHSDEVIDVLIPVIERDLVILPLTVESIRKFSLNKINKIYIIAKESIKITEFTTRYDCVFVEENNVAKTQLNKIDYKYLEHDRSGWIFQQLLKLNWNCISEKKYCLIFDADTILIRNQLFIKNKKLQLNCSDEFHLPYRECYLKLFGVKPSFPVSFVSHYMVMERDSLKQMKYEIEKRNKMFWEDAIIENLIKSSISGFSEYESYGNFLFDNYKRNFQTHYWYNLSLPRVEQHSLEQLIEKYSKKYKSISYHWHS